MGRSPPLDRSDVLCRLWFQNVCPSSRHALIRDMEDTPLSAMDEEMSEMLFRMVKRLKNMSDEEFSALYIAPDTLMD